jgi:hypothetical protein
MMRSRALALSIYLAVCAGCVGLGAFSTWQIQGREAAVQRLDGDVQLADQRLASTHEDRYADDERLSLHQQRVELSSAAAWFEVRIGCLMLLVLSTFAFYVHRSIASFSEEITDPERAATARADHQAGTLPTWPLKPPSVLL